ncbi:MAG TPA: hypothetical protein VNE17_06090, partial [Nitrolancea sp.]|nr:hypothetical protein [Nitrolancea sp.]
MNFESGYQKLMDEVTNGRLSRRAVLKRGVALGLSAPAIAALLAACGSSSNTPAATTAASTTAPTTAATTAATTASGGTTATSASGTSATPAATTAATATQAASSGPRGGGGALRLLFWQAPTIINCHLSSGTKDFDAARLCLEPLIEA